MKSLIRRFVPRRILSLYHHTLAALAGLVYGYPSRKLVVIGVTGTKGKTTTAYFIAKILEAAGRTVGMTSTAIMKIGAREWLNPHKQTMLGRFALQRFLRDMVRAGCTHAVIETSSEGILQHRHRGIKYDAAVFTNLTPEHIEAHGSFENYKKAKGELFRHARIAIVNADDPAASYFLSFPAEKKVTYSIKENRWPTLVLKLKGKFNVSNALAAATTAEALGVSRKTILQTLAAIESIPGRMEFIDEGQPFTVVVDYAHEPASFLALFDALADVPHERIIHVFGPTGGGRDRSKRPRMGEISAGRADVIIVTTDDPYDDDPEKIAQEVVAGAEEYCRKAKIRRSISFVVDRREAIRHALSVARPRDLVVITGKGSEQAMVVRGKKIPWDDRTVVRETLRQAQGDKL